MSKHCIKLAALVAGLSLSAEGAQLGIIIDDLGNNLQRDSAVLELPQAVALSVIPHGHFAHQVAAKVISSGHELLIHQPMSSLDHQYETTHTLNLSMSAEEISARVADNLVAFPEAIGVNNHMGSEFTQHNDALHAVMSELGKHDLFFIDSRTTADSQAFNIACESGLASAKRDVFLDNSREAKELDKQFQRALRIAQRQGSAIIIAHPHTATLRFLTSSLANLDPQVYSLVPISQLVKRFCDSASLRPE